MSFLIETTIAFAIFTAHFFHIPVDQNQATEPLVETYSCSEGPTVHISGTIISISLDHSAIEEYVQTEDGATITFSCQNHETEGGITIVSVEDVAF